MKKAAPLIKIDDKAVQAYIMQLRGSGDKEKAASAEQLFSLLGLDATGSEVNGAQESTSEAEDTDSEDEDAESEDKDIESDDEDDESRRRDIEQANAGALDDLVSAHRC